MKIIHIDVETTGTDPLIHGLTQVAGIVEIDGVVKESFNLLMCPHDGKSIDAEALEIQGLSLRDLDASDRIYSSMAFSLFMKVLEKHVDRYDKKDKFFFVGYNVRFDNDFIRQWFLDNGDTYFGSWFWTPSVDVMALAIAHLVKERPDMTDFKLGTVAAVLGLNPEGNLHDALTDIKLTREILLKVSPESWRV